MWTLSPAGMSSSRPACPRAMRTTPQCAKRNVEVKADQPTIVDFVLTQLSSMRVKVVDGTSGAPIYGVKLTLKDSSGKIVDEYTTNNEGYVTLRGALVDGTYTLNMISVPNGYTADTIPKTIEVLNGQTAEVVWKSLQPGGPDPGASDLHRLQRDFGPGCRQQPAGRRVRDLRPVQLYGAGYH